MMTSVPTLTIVFLLSALLLAVVASCLWVYGKAVRRSLARRAQMRKELSGDWWARFERDLDAYMADKRRSDIHHRAHEAHE